MKNVLTLVLILFVSFAVYAQELEADDFVVITQQDAAYPGFNAKTYRGLFPVGHGQFKMFNYGGTPDNLTALGTNETLGSFVFNGYDGTKNVISAVIQAKTITDSKDPRFNFLLSNGVGNQRPNRMTIIGQTGNVGIGITDPTEKLDVNGSIRMREGAMAGYIPVADADGKMIWTDPNTITTAADTDWLIDADGELYRNDGVYIGIDIDTTDGHTLNVQYDGFGDLGNGAVSGENSNSGNIYSEGQLGVLVGDPFPGNNPMNLPLIVTNIGVYGSKPANGSNGAAIYGWNNDDESTNYSGLFVADGTGNTNYGLYSSASNGSINWAGYFAEGNVYVQNRIGINDENPSAYLDIETDAATITRAIEATVNYTGDYDVVAINATSVPNDDGYGFGVYSTGGYIGVRGNAMGDISTFSAFGVFGSSSGTAGTRYSIYGANPSGSPTTAYAGYFSGDVTVTGTFNNPSDEKLKKNVKDYDKALEVINQLDAKTYEFKNNEYEQMGLPEGNQIGFIAQELEKVLPSLVKENVQPEVVEHDKEGKRTIVKEAVKYKGVNYKGLIPVLAEGIKELSTTVEEKEEAIEALTKDNATMKTEMAAMTKQMNEMAAMLENMNDKFEQMEEDMSSCCLNEIDNRTGSTNINVELNGSDVPSLEQNSPNPFYEQTIIKYYIPSATKSARMTITDIKGSPLKSIDLTDTGLGRVTIHANELPVGTYIYTLFVDGRQIESKQMILVR